MHGGTTPRGAASASFKNGLTSRDLPTRLAALYEQERNDPELLKLHDAVALAKSRAKELLSQLDQGGGTVAWARVAKTLQAFKAAQGTIDMVAAMVAHEEAVKAGWHEAGVWADLWAVVDRLTRYAVMERKTAVAESTSLQVGEALALFGALVAIVRKHVSDRDTLLAISRDAERLIAHGSNDAGDN